MGAGAFKKYYIVISIINYYDSQIHIVSNGKE